MSITVIEMYLHAKFGACMTKCTIQQLIRCTNGRDFPIDSPILKPIWSRITSSVLIVAWPCQICSDLETYKPASEYLHNNY